MSHVKKQDMFVRGRVRFCSIYWIFYMFTSLNHAVKSYSEIKYICVKCDVALPAGFVYLDTLKFCERIKAFQEYMLHW